MTMTPLSHDVPASSRAGAAKRPTVVHYYDVPIARLAEAIGMPTPYLCGRYSKKATSEATARRIRCVGGLMVASQKRDCTACVRVVEKRLADQGGA